MGALINIVFLRLKTKYRRYSFFFPYFAFSQKCNVSYISKNCGDEELRGFCVWCEL